MMSGQEVFLSAASSVQLGSQSMHATLYSNFGLSQREMAEAYELDPPLGVDAGAGDACDEGREQRDHRLDARIVQPGTHPDDHPAHDIPKRHAPRAHNQHLQPRR